MSKCRWINGELDKLPKYINTTNRGNVNWNDSVGLQLKCLDSHEVEHFITIKSKIKNKSRVLISSEGNELEIFTGSFINCSLNSLFNVITKDFKKSINDKIGNFIIVDFKRIKDKQEKEWKYYITECQNCGNIKEIREDVLLNNKGVCNRCSDGISFSEKFAINTLSQLKISYLRQQKYKWCEFSSYDDKNIIVHGAYDFVLIDKYIEINKIKYKIIIEMDGGFHFKDNKMNGQSKEESKYLDDKKDEIAMENGYFVIRINCDYPNLEKRFEFIKQNFINNKYIKNVVNTFNEVDWEKAYESSCCNLKLKCWDLKNNNMDLFGCEIANILGISDVTVLDYLKEGNKYGKCIYNPLFEKQKRIQKTISINSKPIEIFKNEISLGIFTSSSDCARKYLELFGIELSPSHIRSVCKGFRNSHKGLTFREITKEEYNQRLYL